MSADDRRARFRALHEREQLFVMPNPWDVGSAKLLASLGFEALATTSAGLAWSLGKLDQAVTRAELVTHVAALAEATPLPLNVDSERCYPDDPGGVAETVALLAEAGAAGFSIEDYDPASGRVDDVSLAAERVAVAAEAAHGPGSPLVLTARAENHIRGVDDFDDTVSRLIAYRDAGADAVYAPGLRDLGQIAALVEAVGVPVNVLALRGVPAGRRARVGRGAARVHRRRARRGGIRRAGRRRTRASGRRRDELRGRRRPGRGVQGCVRLVARSAREREPWRQHVLELEQPALELDPAAVAAEPVRREHAVTGNDERDRVARHQDPDLAWIRARPRAARARRT